MKIKRLLTLVLSAALPVFVFAGGETGGDVLKVDAGNRASGMAGAYTAAGAGVESIFYNPAGMSSLLKTQFVYSHLFSYASMAVEQISFGKYVDTPLIEGSAGLSILYRHMPAISNADAKDAPVEFYDFVLAGVFANDMYSIIRDEFYKNLTFGISAKLIFENIGLYKATTYAADLGIKYAFPGSGFALGAAVLNAGAPVKIISESAPLPLTARIGARYQFDFDADNHLDLALDYIHDFYDYPRAAFGIEDKLIDMLYLRLGINAPFDSRSAAFAAAGFGVKITQFEVDVTLNYTYKPVFINGFNVIESTHSAGMTVDLP